MSHEPWHKETRGEKIRGGIASAGSATKSAIDSVLGFLGGGGGGGPYGIGHVDDALLAIEDALGGQSQIEPRLIASGAGAAGRALQALPGGMVAAGERLQGGQRVEDRLLGGALSTAGGLLGGNVAPAAAAPTASDPALRGGPRAPSRPGPGVDPASFMTPPDRVRSAGAGDRSLGSPEPMHRAAFDLSTIADAMMRPDVNGTLKLAPDGGITFSSKAASPDQSPGGSANQQGAGFSGLNVPTSLADLPAGVADTTPPSGSGWGMMGPGTGATTEADVAEYLAMLEGLGSDDARIDFALDPMGDGSAPGFLSEEAAAELRLGGGGLGDPNSDKYVWKDGKIDLIGAPVTTTTTDDDDDDDGGEPDGGEPDGGEPDGGDPDGVVADGEEFTLTENQVNTVTNKVQERANIINSMVKAGLIDIGTARTMYDESVATIFSNFIGEQGRILRAFKDDLAAAGVQRESDRNAMLATLRQAGIDPGLISAQLAEIDAIYGEGSQAQRDYLDNITRIGSMANIEHGLMGDYIFGGYEQQLRSEGRRMAADAALAGVDKTEALELAGQQAAQLAGIYGGSPDSILAGLLSGVDVAGTLEQRRAVEDAQQFATDERLASERFATGERLGSQRFASGQNLFNTLAGRMTTPYQQAQLDLAEKRYDLDLFETLDEMMQPTDAAVQQQMQQQTAADYKSALQTWNSAQAIAGRTGSPMPNPVDVLSESQIDALYQYGVELPDLPAKTRDVSALSAYLKVPENVLLQSIDSGVHAQVVADAISHLVTNDPTVMYQLPGTEAPVALPQSIASLVRGFYEGAAETPFRLGGSATTPGINLGTYESGVDPRMLESLLLGAGPMQIDLDTLGDLLVQFGN